MIKKVRALRVLSGRAASGAAALTSAELPRPLGSLRSVPVIGPALAMLTRGRPSRLHEYVDRQHQRLGPLFAEILGDTRCVFLADADDMRMVFGREGQYPGHVYPEPWRYYNQLKNVKRGIFFMEGKEWFDYRRVMNIAMLKNSSYEWLFKPCERVAQDLTHQWSIDVLPNQLVPNLTYYLYKWSVESVSAVLLGNNYTMENKEKLAATVDEFVPTMRMIFQATHSLSFMKAETARKWRLPQWKRFEDVVDIALEKANALSKLLLHLHEGGDGLLERLIKGGIEREDSVRIVTDLLLAAGDTSANTMEWILYLLGKNKDVQQRIYEDIKREGLEKPLPIIKGAVREALRLYPVAPFLNRILDHEVVVKGHRISKDTLMLLSIYTAGRDSKYFTEPLRFWPERWYRCLPADSLNGTYLQAAVAHASTPFAMGSRSCIGKKLAEAQMYITIGKILEKFTVELLNEKDIRMIMRLVAVPAEPIRIALVPRK